MIEAYCSSCEANFFIESDMDERRYCVEYCVYCGQRLDEYVCVEDEEE